MKQIKLNTGDMAIVDDDDYETQSKYKWYVSCDGYASRREKQGDKYVHIVMHRYINKTPKGMLTDHINRNKLDNRKENLRTCNPSQNSKNRNKQASPSSSIYKGVQYCKSTSDWRVVIKSNGKCIQLLGFKSEIDAANAYNELATKLHGNFASLNDIRKPKP